VLIADHRLGIGAGFGIAAQGREGEHRRDACATGDTNCTDGHEEGGLAAKRRKWIHRRDACATGDTNCTGGTNQDRRKKAREAQNEGTQPGPPAVRRGERAVSQEGRQGGSGASGALPAREAKGMQQERGRYRTGAGRLRRGAEANRRGRLRSPQATDAGLHPRGNSGDGRRREATGRGMAWSALESIRSVSSSPLLRFRISGL
jgi:hypothetical protein